VRSWPSGACRPGTAQHSTDTFTGASLFSEITSAINSTGFTTVPVGLRYASNGGSRCQIIS
jgi:hypothetical protein